MPTEEKINRNHNRTTNNNNNVIPDGYSYCWSHGNFPQRGTKPHNSATCRNQKPDHKSKSTVENKLAEKTRMWKYISNT